MEIRMNKMTWCNNLMIYTSVKLIVFMIFLDLFVIVIKLIIIVLSIKVNLRKTINYLKKSKIE